MLPSALVSIGHWTLRSPSECTELSRWVLERVSARSQPRPVLRTHWGGALERALAKRDAHVARLAVAVDAQRDLPAGPQVQQRNTERGLFRKLAPVDRRDDVAADPHA